MDFSEILYKLLSHSFLALFKLQILPSRRERVIIFIFEFEEKV